MIEVPDDQLGGKIGVWGQTTVVERQRVDGRRPDGSPGDQHGVQHQARRSERERPPRTSSTHTPPSKQRTAYGGQFRTNVITTLTNINAVLGTGHADYTVAQAQGLADFLLPDVLTYDTATGRGGSTAAP